MSRPASRPASRLVFRRRPFFGLPALAGALVCLGTAAAAQPQPQAQPQPRSDVLAGAALTEDAVVRQLEPLTRAFGRPPQPRSASLLITFETNSATLTPEAMRQLDIVAGALRRDRLRGQTFQVEGHADPRGGDALNQVLSQQRAEAVRGYLVRTHGIGADRLLALGKGAHELANRLDPAAPENRRVTFRTQQEPAPAEEAQEPPR